MKFLRFICNFLLYIVTMAAICLVQVGGYDLVACQDNYGLDKETSVEVINVIPSEDHVEFIDTFTFWATDISTGVHTPAKYRIRSWGNGWWAKNMGWADTALDTVIAVGKPIFVPIAQVNALKDYYITDDYTIVDIYKKAGIDDAQIYEMYVVFADYTYDSDEIREYISDYDYSSYEGTHYETGDETQYLSWVKEHGNAFNVDWKIQKYNQEAYKKYFRKFIYSNGEGVRTIKSSIINLYYIQLASAILALIFVIKYPVSLLQLKYENGKKRRKETKGE